MVERHIKYSDIPIGGERFYPEEYEMRRRNIVNSVQYFRKRYGLNIFARLAYDGVWVFRGNE